MKLKIFILLMLFCVTPAAALTDVFEDVIIDSEEQDFYLDPVELNDGAASVDVSSFDIAGVLLGMQYEDVHNLFFENKSLYVPTRKNSVIYTIHQDWKDNLDYECRQQNIFVPNELEQCVKSMAKNRGLLYVSEIRLIRENTGETLAIYFTSNATDNRVWRVMYNNDVNVVEGESEKFARQKDKKIMAWWQNVLDKYGAPNSGTDTWISSTNAYDPTMKAYFGSLDMYDMGRHAMDDAENVQRARENFKGKTYFF